MAKPERNTENGDFFHYIRAGIAVLIVVLVVLSAYFFFRLGMLVFTNEPVTTLRTEVVTYELTVVPGERVLTIGMELEDHGIIKNAMAFWIQSRVYQCRIAPGTYTVTSKMSSKEIMKYLNQEYLNLEKEKE